MFPVIFVLLVLQLPPFVSNFTNEACLRRRGTSVRKDGDVVIGGFLSLYTVLYFTAVIELQPVKDVFTIQCMPNTYQNFLALIFAIEEINKNPHLLPNISLGYEFHNFLYSHWKVLESSLILLTGQDEIPNYTCQRENKCVAVLTGTAWATSAHIGPLLELYKFPQVTFGSFDPKLRDSGQFPSIYQVAPKDTSLATGVASLLLHFRWTWVGLAITEGQKGLQFLSDIRAEMDRNSICVAFVKMMTTTLMSYLSYTQQYDILTRETLPNCAPNISLAWLPVNRFDMALSDMSYNIYNAVYAVAHALHRMLLQQGQMPLTGKRGEKVFSPWQLHPFLKNTQFRNPAGDQLNLDDKRKRNVEYDILNYWNFPEGLRRKVKVGVFSSHAPLGQQLSLFEDLIEWSTEISESPHSVCSDSCRPGFRKTPQEGKPACCFDCTPCPENEIANDTDMETCVKCPNHQYANTQRTHCLQKTVTFLAYEDPLGKVLAGSALSLTVLTAAVLGLFVKHRDTPIVKANNRGLSYTLLGALTFCFLCSLLFIGRPNTATCILQQTTFGVGFTVAVSTVLAKTLTVVLAFKVTAPGRRVRQLLVSGAPNSIIPICCLLQITLCGIWMGTNPPFIDTDAQSEHGHIIIVCNKGSLAAFHCVLGYLGSLALGSFTVAFLARNLPDAFNKAKFLTFSTVVFCSVWLTFLPVYHSTKGKLMVAMEVFSILASSAGLLGCIFVPKCYVILLRPERNSLPKFRDKTHSGSRKSS
ncbi:vomeronasal type-2 receptor 116-like [Ctenodactylus gundi]